MTYLLDINVMSDRFKKRPSAVLATRLAHVAETALAISAITFGEMLYGAHRVRKERPQLLGQVENLVIGLEILPFDEAVAHRYGFIRAEMEQVGKVVEEADLRIAATALANGLIMVTRNVRHFGMVPGLIVDNWFE